MITKFIKKLFGYFLYFIGFASFGCVTTSPIYIVLALLFLYWGFCMVAEPKPVSGSSGEGGYSGTTHYGTGMPDRATTDRGHVDFHDINWTNYGDTMYNPVTDVTVEKDFYGNYVFSDDNGIGPTDHCSDYYGRYSMEYDD